MEYRTLPHDPNVRVSTIGLGAAYLHEADDPEALLEHALESGVNFFDFVPGEAVSYEYLGNVLAPVRQKVYLQMHLGCDYSSGKYGWTRDLDAIKRDFQRQMDVVKTDYADFGFIHCMDAEEDFDSMFENGLYDYALQLKEQGTIRHLAFSTHNPKIGMRFLELGTMDLCMFSINPMYDYTDESEYGKGGLGERATFYRACESAGVAISVMKPFAGGQLLDAKKTPFERRLSSVQCIQYALDKPAVITVVPGASSIKQLDAYLQMEKLTAEMRSYTLLGRMIDESALRRCVYCRHCEPCPAGIEIALVSKYYDLALEGDEMAASHYDKLQYHAERCIHCGHCKGKCPFMVDMPVRMREIQKYFGK